MKNLLIVATLGILTACSPYEIYQPPLTYTPEEWKNPVIESNLEAPCQWWEIFQCEHLNELESRALDKNYSLEEAFQNWQQAQAMAYVARSAQFPQINLNPNFIKEESLLQIYSQKHGQTKSKLIRCDQSLYSIPLDVTYEVDLWNQLSNNYKAFAYNAQAQQEAYQTAILIITADVALHFFILQGLDSELDVLDKNRKIRQDALDITQSRYSAGLVNFSDVSRAETELAVIKSDWENTMRLRNLEENILATLTAQSASDFSLPHSPLDGIPPSIPSGIPSELLLRRPDIRQAEQDMASTHTEIAVQYADYFPALTFQGAIGYLSPLCHNLFDWKARFWSIAGNIAQVVFDGGAIQGNVAAAKAVYLQNVAIYQNTVLKAFQEVEDALGDIHHKARQKKDLFWAVENAKVTLDLTIDRYSQGLVYYLEVVDAERSLLENQRDLVKVRSQEYTSTVLLIKSLGGEWSNH